MFEVMASESGADEKQRVRLILAQYQTYLLRFFKQSKYVDAERNGLRLFIPLDFDISSIHQAVSFCHLSFLMLTMLIFD